MSNYLISGVAGFIGARVAELLLESSHSVIGIDNMNNAYDVRMKRYRLKKLEKNKAFSFHEMDIASWDEVQNINANVDGFDAVINLAARAGVRSSVENPWVYVDTNITGTLNLLEFCQRNQIKKFLLASTSSVYGSDAMLPTPETANTDKPLQAYAASKKSAEVLCHAYHYLYDIDISIVRFFTVYGPAGRPDMSIFRFIRWIVEGETIQLFGDGNQSRGFTYIDDIARGVIQGLKPIGFEVVNLGGHQDITINQLISLIEKYVGKQAIIDRLPPVKADMKSNLADVSKAGSLFGWEPRVGLDEGITRTIQWYYENRGWASQLDLKI